MNLHEVAVVALHGSSEHNCRLTQIGLLRVRNKVLRLEYTRKEVTFSRPISTNCDLISIYRDQAGVWEPTYDVVSWTEGVNLRLVFVGLEALDCNLQRQSASWNSGIEPV